MLFVAGAVSLCGCSSLGPRSIMAGRALYAEVINRTQDEEILNVVVRQRYDETFGMVSVASITANLNFSARAGANIGAGDSDDYAGNLVPLSAGVLYEENPTISYVPLSGEDFMRRMLSPLGLDEWTLLSGSSEHPGRVLDLVARSVNGLKNPVLIAGPSSGEFSRFVELFDRLRRGLVLHIVQRAEPPRGHFVQIHDYEGSRDSVRELLDLAGIKLKLDGSTILLPLRDTPGRSTSAIHVHPRSAYEILKVMGTGIEIPPSHLETRVVESAARPGQNRFITIHSSEKPPENASIRTRFRDQWFYIDATDARSKRAFALLRVLIGMRLSDPGADQRAPVLTIPVN